MLSPVGCMVARSITGSRRSCAWSKLHISSCGIDVCKGGFNLAPGDRGRRNQPALHQERHPDDAAVILQKSVRFAELFHGTLPRWANLCGQGRHDPAAALHLACLSAADLDHGRAGQAARARFVDQPVAGRRRP